LTVLFRLVLQRPVGSLHAAREGLLEALRGYRFGQPARTFSVASKRNLVNPGKTFLNWCREQGALRSNPLEGYRALGRANRGKPQLTADEAVRFMGT
jgi:hypothetical protein